jgi:hypothetical protein
MTRTPCLRSYEPAEASARSRDTRSYDRTAMVEPKDRGRPSCAVLVPSYGRPTDLSRCLGALAEQSVPAGPSRRSHPCGRCGDTSDRVCGRPVRSERGSGRSTWPGRGAERRAAGGSLCITARASPQTERSDNQPRLAGTAPSRRREHASGFVDTISGSDEPAVNLICGPIIGQ